jgi:Carboxypeptidase regulatory-like domain
LSFAVRLGDNFRMRRVKTAGAVALMAAVFSLGSFAAEQSKITVQVKNKYDKPVENAEVILDFVGSHQVTKLGKRKPIHWELRTNQEGRAHFPPVPHGTVQLQVNAKKYQTFGDKFDVDTDEKTIDVTLNPPQPQYSAHPPLKQ